MMSRRPAQEEQHMNQQQPATNTRTAWAALLAIIGLFNIGIGVAVLYGGAWAATIIGATLTLHALALTIPDNKIWG
jgi:hypothetical protein